MGWTYQHAKFYYENGKINKKLECDNILTWENDNRSSTVLKSTMKGTVYYAAVQTIDKINGKVKVWGCVGKIHTAMSDYHNFGYKFISEDMGPCECECPASILKLLSYTPGAWANQWRDACYQNIEKKKKLKSQQKIKLYENQQC